jgi:hypothetical protein
MSTSGRVVHYIGLNCQSPNPHTVLNGNFVFDLRDIFQERDPGIKRDLPIYKIKNKTIHVCVHCSLNV